MPSHNFCHPDAVWLWCGPQLILISPLSLCWPSLDHPWVPLNIEPALSPLWITQWFWGLFHITSSSSSYCFHQYSHLAVTMDWTFYSTTRSAQKSSAPICCWLCLAVIVNFRLDSKTAAGCWVQCPRFSWQMASTIPTPPPTHYDHLPPSPLLLYYSHHVIIIIFVIAIVHQHQLVERQHPN